MGRTCSGICTRLQSAPVHNSLRYKLGHKRCTFCEVFFLIKDARCPCCKVVLRTKPRNKTIQ